MNPLEIVRVATRALNRNKLRSFLTTLGIVIGVFAVIAMVAIGEGAKARVEQSLSSMGSNLLIVLPGTSSRGGSFGGFGSQPTLTWDDLAAIRTEAPGVLHAVATMRSAVQVQSEDSNWTTSVTGTSPEFFDIRDWKPQAGALFGDSEMETGAKVAVLGQTVAEKLFGPNVSPVGQPIRIRNVPFQIIGLLQKKGQSPMGTDNDDVVVVPHTTFRAKLQGSSLQSYIGGLIMIQARDAGSIDRAESGVATILRDRHRIPPGGEDDFSVRNLAEIAGAVQAGTDAVATLLAAIAAVSLIVGGIGIMNIMLVSVTERTREIGLRMAVGAEPRAILSQFLAESLTLALTGGAIGLTLGQLGAYLVARRFGWPNFFRLDVIAIAVGFSALVGVVFGIYPAQKASRLDPIEALRYE